jgi:preprotein translocase subunit SecA
VPDEWDLPALVIEIGTYYPSTLAAEDLADVTGTDELYERIMGEATGYYEQREKDLSPGLMRELERTIMLNILDQQWREHLYEMDYLREGIGLRAMGQRDPLTEWQREGYDMFAQMMKSVAQDFVRYIMHADVRLEAPAEPEPSKVVGMTLTSSDNVEPAALGGGAATGAPAAPAAEAPTPAAAAAAAVRPGRSGSASRAQRVTEALAAPAAASSRTVVKDERQKLGPNAPCYCGSGRKFKHCHGNRARKPADGESGAIREPADAADTANAADES